MGKSRKCRWGMTILAAIGVAGFMLGHAATTQASHSGTVPRDRIKPFIPQRRYWRARARDASQWQGAH